MNTKKKTGEKEILIPAEVYDLLMKRAEARGLTVDEYAALLLRSAGKEFL